MPELLTRRWHPFWSQGLAVRGTLRTALFYRPPLSRCPVHNSPPLPLPAVKVTKSSSPHLSLFWCLTNESNGGRQGLRLLASGPGSLQHLRTFGNLPPECHWSEERPGYAFSNIPSISQSHRKRFGRTLVLSECRLHTNSPGKLLEFLYFSFILPAPAFPTVLLITPV